MSLSADQVSKHVETLHKAMKGMGTNENQLIEVLGTTSAPQMDQIAKSFKAALGKDLLEEIKSETRGNFATLAQDLVTPAAHFDAKCVQSAVQGMGTDEELLIEVIVGRSNAEIAAMKAAYSTIYKQDLEKDVANDLDGKLKRFFVGMVQGQRDESQQVLDINRDVESLFNAGQGKWGTDESAFFMILNTRSESHLRAVFAAYEKQHGNSLVKVIKSEFTGTLEKCLVALVRAIENRPLFLAKRFEKAMAEFGTKDEMLMRLAVRCRDPKLMAAIKAAYQQEYSKPLVQRVDGETSGDYGKLLTTIVGN